MPIVPWLFNEQKYTPRVIGHLELLPGDIRSLVFYFVFSQLLCMFNGFVQQTYEQGLDPITFYNQFMQKTRELK